MIAVRVSYGNALEYVFIAFNLLRVFRTCHVLGRKQ